MKETAFPLAYFLTFTCYGTWLHGDKAVSVDSQNKRYGAPFLSPDRARCAFEKSQLKNEPYYLDECQRNIVLAASNKENSGLQAGVVLDLEGVCTPSKSATC